jgi:hypothetical protein
VRASGRSATHWSAIERKAIPLRLFLDYFDERPADDHKPDILDPAIRSKRTAEEVLRTGSEISRRWNVISSLKPEDFTGPIRSALAPR